LDIATKPDADVRVRSKRSSATRPQSKAASTPRLIGTANGKHAAGVGTSDGAVVELQEMLARVER